MIGGKFEVIVNYKEKVKYSYLFCPFLVLGNAFSQKYNDRSMEEKNLKNISKTKIAKNSNIKFCL